MPNALASETSPYLRQHQDNPVDWLPWGQTALQKARADNKPLLVSIGYSACHWCHVMERESFEDPRIAAIMNEEFVCVKVDREERPDIDALYMEAVQGMTGHGGWPLNVFLTPEQLPFYGGTYFPPEPRHGLPAFSEVLHAIAEAWRAQGEEIRAGGERLRERLASGARLMPSAEPFDSDSMQVAVERLGESFDARNGGFGGAPKFPQSPVIELLLSAAAKAEGSARETEPGKMALLTLTRMAAGGIHDHLGGGFHRYAVDARWAVPHFEKMLYDNALLARTYLHAFKLFGDPELLDVCVDTLSWALREMRGPEGGFYSALDADSEGIEGRFYVWTLAQMRDALGEDADAAIDWFAASEEGNFSDPHHPEPGLNVLQAHGPIPPLEQRERIRATLATEREARARPGLDHKRLTSWNALMISALAQTGAHLRVLEAQSSRRELGQMFIDAASGCARFILSELRDPHERLLRTYVPGQAKLNAYLEDHAFLLEALLDLYEATFEGCWFQAALGLADEIIERFSDPEQGGFFSTSSDHEKLIARRKDLEDSPIPSGSSSAALGLLRLARMSGQRRYEEHAVKVLALEHQIATRHPSSFGYLLQALDFHLSPIHEIAIVGTDRTALERVVRERPAGTLVLACAQDAKDHVVALLAGREAVDGKATAYVCEHFACRAPVSDPEELRALLHGP